MPQCVWKSVFRAFWVASPPVTFPLVTKIEIKLQKVNSWPSKKERSGKVGGGIEWQSFACAH